MFALLSAGLLGLLLTPTLALAAEHYLAPAKLLSSATGVAGGLVCAGSGLAGPSLGTAARGWNAVGEMLRDTYHPTTAADFCRQLGDECFNYIVKPLVCYRWAAW